VLEWLATKRAFLLIIAPGEAGECIGDIVATGVSTLLAPIHVRRRDN